MNTLTAANKTILVIEDDNALLGIITDKLHASQLNVISARSVDEIFTGVAEEPQATLRTADNILTTLERLHALPHIDAVWLDHNLIGEDDGIDFIVKLKANGGNWSTIPVFVVSNSANPDLIKTYAEIGISHYYLKAEHRLGDIVNDINTALALQQ